MRNTGFEPVQVLNHESLNLAHLTTLAIPHIAFIDRNTIKRLYKKLYKPSCLGNIEDGHNRLETPVPFPNTEVKLPMLVTLVPQQARNHQAVFHFFYFLLINLKSSFLSVL